MLWRNAFIGYGVALVLLTVPSFADRKKQLTVEIEGDGGPSLSMSISADFLDSIIEELAEDGLQCNGEIESDTRRMLEHLSRQGEGSKYTLEREDGEVIKARRRQGQLQLNLQRSDAKDVQVSLPWQVAECMLGREVAGLRGDEKLELSVDGDGALLVRVE